jgi:hypothetical protein
MRSGCGLSCLSKGASYLCEVVLTLIFWPPISLLFSALMAAAASAFSGISTNPKPLDCPLPASVTRLCELTCPNGRNISSSSFSVIKRGRFLTIIFMNDSFGLGLILCWCHVTRYVFVTAVTLLY